MYPCLPSRGVTSLLLLCTFCLSLYSWGRSVRLLQHSEVFTNSWWKTLVHNGEVTLVFFNESTETTVIYIEPIDKVISPVSHSIQGISVESSIIADSPGNDSMHGIPFESNTQVVSPVNQLIPVNQITTSSPTLAPYRRTPYPKFRNETRWWYQTKDSPIQWIFKDLRTKTNTDFFFLPIESQLNYFCSARYQKKNTKFPHVVPMFTLRGRNRTSEIYSFADIVLKLRSPTARVMFVGDSLLRDIFKLSICSLSMTKSVRILSEFYRYELADFNGYIVGTSFSINQSKSVNVTFVRKNKLGLELAKIIDTFCSSQDLFIIDQGLHQADVESSVFVNSAVITFDTLDECRRRNPNTVVAYYSNHPPHFPFIENGRYVSKEVCDKTEGCHCWDRSCPCRKVLTTAEEADVITYVFRTHALPRTKNQLEFLPPPWDTMDFTCKRFKNESSSLISKIHWIPGFDLGFDLHEYHLGTQDCLHFILHPLLIEGIWEAIYFAVHRNFPDSCQPDNFVPQPQSRSYYNYRYLDPEWKQTIYENMRVLSNVTISYSKDFIVGDQIKTRSLNELQKMFMN